jgi:hypothetical protein
MEAAAARVDIVYISQACGSAARRRPGDGVARWSGRRHCADERKARARQLAGCGGRFARRGWAKIVGLAGA